MMRPMNQFCCGCHLSFGVAVILACNLLQNLFYAVTAVMNVIVKEPTFGASASPVEQTFTAAWCLLGLPFILSGIWGVVYRQETNLRVYLYYMFASFTLDTAFLITFFVTT